MTNRHSDPHPPLTMSSKGVDLHGKRILVTGASAGLGVETCRSLVAHGATVVGAVRDLRER